MLKIAHRGASGHAPENTIRSFQKAIDLGADVIEFDIRKSKDGVLVVTHDKDLRRCFGIEKLVGECTLNELKSLDADGEKIPSLKETLFFLKGKKRIIIELKERNCLPLLYAELDNAGQWEPLSIFVVAFDHDDNVEGGNSSWDDLEEFKTARPELEVALLLTPYKKYRMGWRLICDRAIEMGAYAIVPHKSVVGRMAVNYAHQRGLKIFTWIVDERAEAQEFRKIGIDGIASNFPDRLV